MNMDDIAERLVTLQSRLARVTVWQNLPETLDADFRSYRRSRRRSHRLALYLLPLLCTFLVPPLSSIADADPLAQAVRWMEWVVVLPLAGLAVGALFMDMAGARARVMQALAVGATWLWLIALRHLALTTDAVAISPQILGLSWLAVALLAGFAWQRVLPAIWACALLSVMQEWMFAPEGAAVLQAVAGLMLAAALASWAVLSDERLHRELWLEHETNRALVRIDPLTGLANRREGAFQLARCFAVARRKQHALAVSLLDIDNFSELNQVCGPLAGDEALRQFAQRLGATVSRRPTDILARHAGDQFMVVQEDATTGSAAALGAASVALAREISVTDPLQQARRTLRISSVTVYVPNVQGIAPDTLMDLLGQRLAHIKEAGGDQATMWVEGETLPALDTVRASAVAGG